MAGTDGPLVETGAEAGRLRRVLALCRPTVRYCMETEAHVFALAIAASVLLSFYPFIIVMLSFCKNVLRWPEAVDAIYLALNDAFPGPLGDFIKRNVVLPRKVEFTSMFLLLFTANGVFEPLEVALNKVWGVTVNRSYVRNQIVSLGMIFMCGGLALLSMVLSAINREWISAWTGSHLVLALTLNLIVFKVLALPISMLGLFLVYWLLPNRRIPPRLAWRTAVVVGLALEALKYLNLLAAPLLRAKLQREYGVFVNSVNIILWSFVVGMIVLAGAEWSARLKPASGSEPRPQGSG